MSDAQRTLFDRVNPELAADFVPTVQSTRRHRTGEARKQAGMETALKGADTWWADLVRGWVLRLPVGRVFTADDVVAACGLARPSSPNANNAVGAMLAGLARRGWIGDTGRMVRSRRPGRHAGKVVAWKRL